MQHALGLLALAVSAVQAYPQAVTDSIPPSSPAPEGCSPDYPGKFQITVVNVTTSPGKVRRQSNALEITLSGGVLKDAQQRTGYIASNYQFQFDGPPQAGAIYTSGFSVCGNGSLALGGSAVFYQCYSGGFYNLYDRHWAAQCSPIYIEVIGGGKGAAAATQAPDGQPGITTQVSQIADGQVQVTTVPVGQIGDGQLQNGGPVGQISDGQVQATGGGVTQVADGQVQATPAVGQIGDGQVQAGGVTQVGDGQVQAGGVSQILDGQVQASPAVGQIGDGQVQASGAVTQIGDGQVQAPTAPPAPPVGQIGDGQVQASPAPSVGQISDGQVQATPAAEAPVTQVGDGQVQAPPVTQIGDGQVQAGSTVTPVTQIGDGQVQGGTSLVVQEATPTNAPVQQTVNAAPGLAAELPAAVAGLLAAIALL